jgi:hypothetical protein
MATSSAWSRARPSRERRCDPLAISAPVSGRADGLQQHPRAPGKTHTLLRARSLIGVTICPTLPPTGARHPQAAATDFRPPDWDQRDQIEAAAAAAAPQQAGGTAHPEL